MNFYAIDFGHTNYKVAFFSNGKMEQSYGIYDYSRGLQTTINQSKKFEKILCCSVIKEDAISLYLSNLQITTSERMKFYKASDCQKYINFLYKNIDRLGSDRAINLVGASQKTKKDLIVIDAGTATTVDYLDSNKTHCGGIILPGKNIIDESFKKMLDFSFHEEEFNQGMLSNNTRSCIENGSHISAYGVTNIIIEQIKKATFSEPEIFVTGGNAHHIIDNCNYPINYVESLLFDGLMVLGS